MESSIRWIKTLSFAAPLPMFRAADTIGGQSDRTNPIRTMLIICWSKKYSIKANKNTAGAR